MTAFRHLTDAQLESIIGIAKDRTALIHAREKENSDADGFHIINMAQLLALAMQDETDAMVAISNRLESEIMALSREAQNELTALMWYGRSHFDDDTDSFDDLLDYAGKTWNGAEETAEYVAGKGQLLPKYLEKGWERLLRE